MTWVRFVQDFDFAPAALKGRSIVAYRAGMELNVTRECADAAIAAGKAELLAQKREDRDGEDQRQGKAEVKIAGDPQGGARRGAQGARKKRR